MCCYVRVQQKAGVSTFHLLLSLYSLGLFHENVLFELMFMFSTCVWRSSGKWRFMLVILSSLCHLQEIHNQPLIDLLGKKIIFS